MSDDRRLCHSSFVVLFRFGGAAASSLRSLATNEAAVLVKNIASSTVAVFPDLNDQDDPDLAHVPENAVAISAKVSNNTIRNAPSLPT